MPGADNARDPQVRPSRPLRLLRSLLPSPGNVLFTLLAIGTFVWVQSAGALPLPGLTAAGTSTGTIAYQGRLTNPNGAPVTGSQNMTFRLYNVATGGSALWTEPWDGANAVAVTDGLFTVSLGAITPIPQATLTGNTTLWLGISVGTDVEMTPRVQLGSVPYAVQALTVPDGSIATAKLANGAVTSSKVRIQAGLATLGSNFTTTAGPDPIPDLSVQVTVQVPSHVKISIFGRAQNNTAARPIHFQIYRDGLPGRGTSWDPNSGGFGSTMDFSVVDANTTPGTYVYSLRILCGNAGDQCVLLGGTQMLVEVTAA